MAFYCQGLMFLSGGGRKKRICLYYLFTGTVRGLYRDPDMIGSLCLSRDRPDSVIAENSACPAQTPDPEYAGFYSGPGKLDPETAIAYSDEDKSAAGEEMTGLSPREAQ